MTFPLPRPGVCGNDPRFTFGLTFDVAKVLAAHGYPDPSDPMNASDFVELQLTLFRFIYGSAPTPNAAELVLS